MKSKILASIFCFISLSGMCQFEAQPLNFPGTGYWPYYFSIVDPNHMWVGAFHENELPFPYAIKTTDGGNTWIFDSIPLPSGSACVSICGWDANTSYYVFPGNNDIADPSIWRTVDGGTTWSNIITTQFSESFINFYHAFSADTGLAMGDPTDGYFEIQLTYDGGNTWSRVPSSNIPVMLSGEIGLNHSFSAVGNSVWFTTSKSRCFRSTDRGLTWEVTAIIPGTSHDLGVCFSTVNQGVVWIRDATVNQLVVTNDGGVTWDPVSFPANYYIMDMSRIPGWEGAFVITGFTSGMRVFFTPDMFNTLQVLQPNIISNGAIEFYDAATGWLGGGETGFNEIYKFVYVLNADDQAGEPQKELSIYPNPSGGQSLLAIPKDLGVEKLEIWITDISGRVVNHYPVFNRDYLLLDASIMNNGVYMITLLTGKTTLARERWIVSR